MIKKRNSKLSAAKRKTGDNGFNYTQSSKNLKNKYKAKKDLKKMEPFKTEIDNKRSNLKQGLKTAALPIALTFLASKTNLVR